jgi:glutaredoxin
MILYGKEHCPNCEMAKALLDKFHFEYEYVTFEQNQDLAYKYNVTNVPVLITDNGDVIRTNMNIKKWVSENI